MSKVFDGFKFKWEGTEYEVPSDRIFGAIARVEEHVTLGELYAMLDDYRAVKNTQLASAYSALLSYVGSPVGRDEIYNRIFPADSDARMNTINAITGLLELMIPDKVKKDAAAKAEKDQLEAGQELKNENRRARRAAASSSNQPSKRQSVGATSPKNSGDSTRPNSGG